jgi:hypothetical protein
MHPPQALGVQHILLGQPFAGVGRQDIAEVGD